jgi:hypothetical protein
MELLEKIKLETLIMDADFSKKEKLDFLLDMYTDNESKNWNLKRNGVIQKYRVLTVTPDLASILLTYFNDANRPVSPVNVNNLYKEMINGKWLDNGETITFNEDGDMTNGQHRFMALIKANISVSFTIVSGFGKDSFATIDNGRKRTSSDVLAHDGVSSAKNTAALCKFIFGFKQGRYSAHRNVSARTLGNTSIGDYYNSLNDVELHSSVLFGANYSKKSNGIITPTVLGGMLYLFNEVDREKSYDFLSRLCTGDNLVNGSPILALRNKLIKAKIDKTYHLTGETLIKNIVYCWEKFINGETVKVIKLPENYEINLQTNLQL